MVLDFMEGGDLQYQRRELGGTVTEEVAKFWIANILIGLRHIQKENVIHRYVFIVFIMCVLWMWEEGGREGVNGEGWHWG